MINLKVFLHDAHHVPALQSDSSELPVAPQLHGCTERGLPWVSEVLHLPPTPLPSKKWGQHQCQSSSVGVALTHGGLGLAGQWRARARDRKEHKKGRKKGMNGWERPSLKDQTVSHHELSVQLSEVWLFLTSFDAHRPCLTFSTHLI